MEEYADVAGEEGVVGSVVSTVAEVVVEAGGEVKHSLVQDVGKKSACIKHTHVSQVGEAGSFLGGMGEGGRVSCHRNSYTCFSHPQIVRAEAQLST